MVWPVAALALVLLGFVVIYGSRLEARVSTGARDNALPRTERT